MSDSKSPKYHEIPEPVDVIRINAVHDECGGVFEHDGAQRARKAPLGPNGIEYRHRCTACNAGAWYVSAYPRVDYASKPEEAE